MRPAFRHLVRDARNRSSVTTAVPRPNRYNRLVVASIPRALHTSIAITAGVTAHLSTRTVVA